MSRPLLMFVLLILGVVTLLVGVTLGKRQRRTPLQPDRMASEHAPCRICGSSVPDAARYCPRCGTRVAAGQSHR